MNAESSSATCNAENKRQYIYDLKNWEVLFIWTKSNCFWFFFIPDKQLEFLSEQNFCAFLFTSQKAIIPLKMFLSEKESIKIQYQKCIGLIWFL